MAFSDSLSGARAAPYPVRLSVAYPEGGNRFLILVRWFLAIPHYIVWVVFALPLIITNLVAALVLLLIVGGPFEAWSNFFQYVPVWALLVLAIGALPGGVRGYFAGLLRYGANIGAYVYFHNEYPPFSLDPGEYAPVQLEVDEQEFNRFLAPVKWLLAIPHYVVLVLLSVAAFFVYIYIWFAVLFTGRYPRGAFNFCVGVYRWLVRVQAYSYYLLTDRYPPFSLEE